MSQIVHQIVDASINSFRLCLRPYFRFP